MNIFKQILSGIAICTLSVNVGYAQINPLASQYFNNRYLANPAFAGYQQGFNLNLAYRQQWNSILGAPITQNVTADYGTGKVGLGLNVNFEKAGLQRESRVVGTYAYHLPLNGVDQQLHFGLSIGFMNQRLSDTDLNGNPNDPLVGLYNDRKTYVDGDFGAAYTSAHLKLEAALPNMKSFFKKDVIKLANVATFYSAASYVFAFEEGIDGVEVEPKVAYRGFKGSDNILDAGAQLTMANKQVLLMGIYHSTKNASFGLGLDYKQRYLISGAYTTQTSGLSNYTNGTFELNLRLHL